MREITEFSASHDFHFTPVLDGKVHRFDRRGHNNAWQVGWQLFGSKSGEPFYICIFGDWKTGEKYEYKSEGKKLSRDDSAAIKKRLEEAQKKTEEERLLKQDEARSYAKKLWSRSRPVFQSPYYETKKISNAYGSQTNLDPESGDRIIYVPMRDVDGELWGLQRIYPDGSKRFLAGQKINSLFHLIGPELTDFCYITEGFATGATVHEATGKSVVVTFTAGNLEHVALSIRRRYPQMSIIIAGDDDTKTAGNPGRTKAESAAKAVCGSAVFPPVPTDWNDAHVSLGINRVKELLLDIAENREEVGFIPLGFEGSTHYFYTKRSKDVKSFSAFTSDNLMQLVPREYWASIYGTKKGVDWEQARSDVANDSNKAGPFDPFRVRGTGVWLDNGKPVINTGNGVEIKSDRYIYVATKNKMPDIHEQPLSRKECQTILSACENLKWNDPKSGILLAGWIAIARIAGALPIRPHIWLTGSSGSGKSTVMARVIAPALGHESSRLYLQGGSTEAGIRQSVKADALPVIFDEFETTDENSKQRTAQLIELLRQTWSRTEGHVVKGSSGGAASHYAMSFSALVSSIRTGLTNDADRSRFCVLELGTHGSDKAHWNAVKKLLVQITPEYGERLFSRQVKQIDRIVKNYDTISEALSDAISQRFGQQYGMLLAGWYSLYSDDLITKEAAESMPEDLGLLQEKEAAKVTDEIEAYQWLLDFNRIFYGDVGGDRRQNTTKSIARIINDKDPGELEQLRDIGVLVDESYLYVACNHSYLKTHIFKNTRWENCYSTTLSRLPGAIRTTKRFLHGREQTPSAAIKIPPV
jgi:putative DNA primase/helicase